LNALNKLPLMSITEIATVNNILAQKGSQVWTISPNATVFDAIKLMDEKNVGALVVMQGEELVGIISERDYTRKIILKGKTSKETLVKEIMMSPVIYVTPQHSISECMKIMTEHRIRHLPVVFSGKLVGIVSIGDLVNWIISAQNQTINHLEGYINGRYPG